MAVPVKSNTGRGIFEYLTHINGSDAEVKAAQAKLAQLTPTTQAVWAALNLLPEGDLKSWLTANPVQFWKKIVQLFTGRRYTTGDYILGERFNDQVLCNGDISRRQVPDDLVPQAQTFFTIVFGVRIHTEEDLKALDYGVSAYRSRWVSQGIGDEAIERAVYLKQNFFPERYNNVQCWDISYFEQYPLVAPIPGHDLNTLYNGPVLGGATAVNGMIPIDAQTILSQFPPDQMDQEGEHEFEPVPTDPSTGAGGSNVLEKLQSFVKANPGVSLMVVALVGYAAYEYNND